MNIHRAKLKALAGAKGCRENSKHFDCPIKKYTSGNHWEKDGEVF